MRSSDRKASTSAAQPVTAEPDEGPAGEGAPPRFDWRDLLAPNRARVSGRE
jgi:hypothetical protein